MELWIRSQDKHKMLKCELLKYEEYGESFVIRGFASSDNWIIGYYNTKERALEVLDEIQKLDIGNNLNIETVCYAFNLLKVTYNMPKE